MNKSKEIQPHKQKELVTYSKTNIQIYIKNYYNAYDVQKSISNLKRSSENFLFERKYPEKKQTDHSNSSHNKCNTISDNLSYDHKDNNSNMHNTIITSNNIHDKSSVYGSSEIPNRDDTSNKLNTSNMTQNIHSLNNILNQSGMSNMPNLYDTSDMLSNHDNSNVSNLPNLKTDTSDIVRHHKIYEKNVHLTLLTEWEGYDFFEIVNKPYLPTKIFKEVKNIKTFNLNHLDYYKFYNPKSIRVLLRYNKNIEKIKIYSRERDEQDMQQHHEQQHQSYSNNALLDFGTSIGFLKGLKYLHLEYSIHCDEKSKVMFRSLIHLKELRYIKIHSLTLELFAILNSIIINHPNNVYVDIAIDAYTTYSDLKGYFDLLNHNYIKVNHLSINHTMCNIQDALFIVIIQQLINNPTIPLQKLNLITCITERIESLFGFLLQPSNEYFMDKALENDQNEFYKTLSYIVSTRNNLEKLEINFNIFTNQVKFNHGFNKLKSLKIYTTLDNFSLTNDSNTLKSYDWDFQTMKELIELQIRWNTSYQLGIYEDFTKAIQVLEKLRIFKLKIDDEMDKLLEILKIKIALPKLCEYYLDIHVFIKSLIKTKQNNEFFDVLSRANGNITHLNLKISIYDIIPLVIFLFPIYKIFDINALKSLSIDLGRHFENPKEAMSILMKKLNARTNIKYFKINFFVETKTINTLKDVARIFYCYIKKRSDLEYELSLYRLEQISSQGYIQTTSSRFRTLNSLKKLEAFLYDRVY